MTSTRNVIVELTVLRAATPVLVGRTRVRLMTLNAGLFLVS
jgi:hypothetical protein